MVHARSQPMITAAAAGRTYPAVTPTLEQGLTGGLSESRMEKA